MLHGKPQLWKMVCYLVVQQDVAVADPVPMHAGMERDGQPLLLRCAVDRKRLLPVQPEFLEGRMQLDAV